MTPLARWLLALLAFGVVLDLVSLATAGARLDRLAGGDGTGGRAELTGSVGAARAVVLLATVVLFLVWFVRAARNVEARGAPLRHGGGWVLGSWFVPLLNLVWPKQVTDDVWRGSAAGTGGPPERVPVFVHLWWAAFLAALVVDRLVAAATRDASPAGVRRLVAVSRWADAVTAVLGVLAVAVVWSVTQRQRAWTGER